MSKPPTFPIGRYWKTAGSSVYNHFNMLVSFNMLTLLVPYSHSEVHLLATRVSNRFESSS